MDSKQKLYNKTVAVLGAGKFGTAVANLVAPNASRVLLYTNKAEGAFVSDLSRSCADQMLANNIKVTDDLAGILTSCSVIFPVVPAAKFRELMQQMALQLTPEHVLIHGTKGLDLAICQKGVSLNRSHIATMSEVIIQETSVRAIGCLAGPNLSADLIKKHPASTVIASASEKVLSIGSYLLTNNWFRVYPSSDLLSVEMCSVLKNIFAIGAGMLWGSEYGDNTYAFFLTMCIAELYHIMRTMGINLGAVLGPAGIGDLIATCGSSSSRNYTIGYRLAKGENITDILAKANEVSEGVQTVKTIHQLMQSYGVRAPITDVIYRILFSALPLKTGVAYLMCYPAKETSWST
ncbi:NAD(P)H-dependent glycerol-3-phosphate dehydrogenase [Cardinium endosymbiont of Tipula unca]|uniref:NAD(P)H-dependent glycerol-3-phosphate dehydrogenase n=1 Tax=Cardinium endosymbiont of Tipula unca TaxID=3066216 RepID=UPI0030CC746E